ncbi:hypothetical protein CEXT_566621 [Caerostris extrusa]|uniref:Uncharacterized protein n=1 Tax=Caerostris extrusa TaxID=172846 RepID=A0AAV4NGF5_CAEEX|nr:hypothetical protein CEXT_566621 [Caerostris extrusa]
MSFSLSVSSLGKKVRNQIKRRPGSKRRELLGSLQITIRGVEVFFGKHGGGCLGKQGVANDGCSPISAFDESLPFASFPFELQNICVCKGRQKEIINNWVHTPPPIHRNRFLIFFLKFSALYFP